MKRRLVLALLATMLACDQTYTTMEVCLDADMEPVAPREDGEVHLRDIYDDEDSCEEAGGTWYWECIATGEHHLIADVEVGLYDGGTSTQGVCPR